ADGLAYFRSSFKGG
nr:Chain C, 5c2 peptide [synthetic construct]4P2Q_H Chain H, 5c2 peptide [synthetic construct]4P2Q_M Chain M, 5c2 peptide [synthetic construct]4P2Q_R Chain R, 5c2 peptide [synthetic construct]